MWQAESIGIRKYAFLNENKKIFTLEYEGLLSLKAKAFLESGETIEFKPQGFWGHEVQMYKKNEQIAFYQLNWTGTINLFYGEHTYTIQYKGFWKPKILVKDAEKNNLLEVTPHFKWGKLAYEYNFELLKKDFQAQPEWWACLLYSALYLSSFMNDTMGTNLYD